MGFLNSIFDTTGFPARWFCGNAWQREPFWGWLHIGSDLMIWLAYMAIPIIIVLLTSRRRDLIDKRIALLFGAFIFCCGLTHLIEATLFYWPVYRLSGLMKLVTAIVSGTTAIALLQIIPQFLTFRSPQEMERIVEQRTAELNALNERLREEIVQHQATAEQLKLALVAGGMGTWEWDPDQDRLKIDEFQESLTGLDHQDPELNSNLFFESVHPDDRYGLEVALAEVTAGRAGYDYEFRYRKPGTKHYRWLAGRGDLFVVPGTENRILRGVNYDITPQKDRERRLRLSTLAMESARNGIIITDVNQEDNPIVYCNQSFTDLTGYTPGDAIGKNCRFLQGELTDISVVDQIRKSISNKVSCHVRVLNYKKTGEPFWNDLSISPVVDERDKTTHFVGIQSDISEQVQHEERLREAQRQASDANDSKTRYLAHVSHEIRTPMTSIIGCAELLCQNESASAQEMAVLIRDQGKMLLEILNDILDLSKIESGKLQIIPVACDLKDLFNQIHTLMMPIADRKQLVFEFENESELPSTVTVDSLRLRQILLNLINNAIKFTDSGFVRVLVRYDQHNTLLHLHVVDSGKGISKDDQLKIFEAFEQSSQNGAVEGTGLGLAISKHLVNLMHGTIQLTSHVDRGSDFHVTIPLVTSNGVASLKPESTPQVMMRTRPVASIKEAHILLAEDNSSIQYFLNKLLSPSVKILSIAANGQEAIGIYEKSLTADRPVDLILMDMHMPVMNGLDATRSLRERGVEIPIIALTAAAMIEEREQCIQAGCNDVLLKPVDIELLDQCLERWLHQA